jgi:hypothetical protein
MNVSGLAPDGYRLSKSKNKVKALIRRYLALLESVKVKGRTSMPILPLRNGKDEDAFMKWALSTILKRCQGSNSLQWQHPLGFLINPSTMDWYARLGSRDRRATANEFIPPVQAGHLLTRKGLNDIDDQRFAIEDADQNLEASYSGEGREAPKKNPGAFVIIDRMAVDVDGVPVMLHTLTLWEKIVLERRSEGRPLIQLWERLEKILPAGKYRSPHQGWACI